MRSKGLRYAIRRFVALRYVRSKRGSARDRFWWQALRVTDQEGEGLMAVRRTRTQLAIFSSYLDGAMLRRIRAMSRVDMEAELLLLHRTVKVAEELGEMVQRLIGLTGANPRKGVENDAAAVVDELLDIAVTSLGAIEHLTGNEEEAMVLLAEKIGTVYRRAGLGGAS